MTTKEKTTTTNEATLCTQIRKAALSTIEGENRRASATIALSAMMADNGAAEHGIPQTDIVEAPEMTNWLRGDKEDGVLGFVEVVGWEGWTNLDPVTKTNSTMQDVLREVALLVAAGVKFNWWATMDNKDSEGAVLSKNDTIYVRTKNFPGMADDTLPVRDVSFRKLYSAARKKFAKPGVGDGGKNDAALMRRFRLLYLDDNQDPTLSELSPEAIELIPQLQEDLEELMVQFDEGGHQRTKNVDVAAVA